MEIKNALSWDISFSIKTNTFGKVCVVAKRSAQLLNAPGSDDGQVGNNTRDIFLLFPGYR